MMRKGSWLGFYAPDGKWQNSWKQEALGEVQVWVQRRKGKHSCTTVTWCGGSADRQMMEDTDIPSILGK